VEHVVRQSHFHGIIEFVGAILVVALILKEELMMEKEYVRPNQDAE